jgi:hypothetical protein
MKKLIIGVIAIVAIIAVGLIAVPALAAGNPPVTTPAITVPPVTVVCPGLNGTATGTVVCPAINGTVSPGQVGCPGLASGVCPVLNGAVTAAGGTTFVCPAVAAQAAVGATTAPIVPGTGRSCCGVR